MQNLRRFDYLGSIVTSFFSRRYLSLATPYEGNSKNSNKLVPKHLFQFEIKLKTCLLNSSTPSSDIENTEPGNLFSQTEHNGTIPKNNDRYKLYGRKSNHFLHICFFLVRINISRLCHQSRC